MEIPQHTLPHALPPNSLKAALAAGQVQYGIFVGLTDPVAGEVVAGAGFDWMMVDAEHAPNDLRSILGHLQAASRFPTEVVVRPADHDPNVIKRLLDLGVRSLLLPMVESAEQAVALVRATRYPPAGIRGVGGSLARASQWLRIPDYLHAADAQMCVVCQVESAGGVDAAFDIASVDGVDAVFVGPSDLAAALGHLGNPGHPDVQAAIATAFAAIRAAGRPGGVFASTIADVTRYRELGATLIAAGSDLPLFARATAALAQACRDS